MAAIPHYYYRNRIVMAVTQRQKPWQILHWVLSPILAFGIYLSVINLSDTYKLVENYQRESIWSLVHLNTQLNSTQYDMQLYSIGSLAEKELRVRYELMWSKFPVILSNLEKDDMLSKVNGLRNLIEQTFTQIQQMEPAIYSGKAINTDLLPQWIAEINHAHGSIQRYLIHEVTDSDGSYSRASWNKLLNALYYVASTSLVFFIHIAYLLLLLILAKERSDSHFQLSHDSLTGLASRNNTMQVLEEYSKASIPFSLAIIDLNKFKQVNDNYGHQAGDAVLKHLANEFRQTLGKHGLVGRLGGDEFAWIVGVTDKELISRYYGELLEKLKRPCIYDGTHFMISLSTGATACHGDGAHFKTMLSKADEAMYRAKKEQASEVIWSNTNAGEGRSSFPGINSLLF